MSSVVHYFDYIPKFMFFKKGLEDDFELFHAKSKPPNPQVNQKRGNIWF